MLARVSPASQRTVVLEPPPRGIDLQDCFVVGAVPSNCVSEIGEPLLSFKSGQAGAADAAGVEYIDTESWFCVDGQCPAFVGSTPVRTDSGHLTVQYSASLAPAIEEALIPE